MTSDGGRVTSNGGRVTGRTKIVFPAKAGSHSSRQRSRNSWQERRWLFQLLPLLALGFAPAHAVAQAFKPTRTVEIVVHTGPGGGADVMARALATMFEKEKLIPVRAQVNNKTGGGGAVALAYLAEKKGDPHTIGIIGTGISITGPLVSKEARVTIRELTPIARLVLEPALIAVRNDAPYKTLRDFIEAAKQNPGQLKQSAGSISSRDNVVRQLLQKHTGAQWAYISFPGGGERIAALLGGHVNMMVIEPQEAGEHIRAGNMRVLAQVTETRLRAFPGVPTLKEAGFDVPIMAQMRGVVAPPGISEEAARYWEDVFARLVKTASWRAYLEENQLEDGFMRGAELGRFSEELTAKMREILKEAGIKVMR